MKNVIIVIIILLCTTAPAHADFNWGARSVFTAGTKKTIVVAEKALTTAEGRALVSTYGKAALRGGPIRLVHPLVGIVTTAVGAYYLYNDFDDLVGYLETNPDIYDPTTRSDEFIVLGHSVTVRPVGTVYEGAVGMTGMTVTVQPTTVKVNVNHITSGGRCTYVEVRRNGVQVASHLMREGYSVTWVNQTGQSNPQQIVYYDIDEAGVDQMITSLTDDDIDAMIGKGIIPESQVSQTDQVGDDIEPSIYTIETPDGGTDPATDTDYDTDVEPGTDQDSMSVPGFPDLPALDTSIEEPEEKSIPDLLSGWLSNAPFMAIITDMEVTAAGGQSEFIIPLPEVLGGTATMDFGEWSDLWQAMGAIIIAVAYIYGAMIIFGGKS